MNFNPNSYMGYNNYNSNPYMQPQQQSIIPQTTSLNGKIVESQEIVKVTEVPIGGYGIFPRADLTEIYVKTWDANTKQMSILTYKLDTTSELSTPKTDMTSKILERVDSLEQKIDSILAGFSPSVEESAPAAKKEVKKNAF